MSKHNHEHSGTHQHSHKPQSRAPHKDWRAWVVVGLMLAAMVAYILSDNESIEPDGEIQESVPAAD
jgi:hypothetical protein